MLLMRPTKTSMSRGGAAPARNLFITVGTTQFDDLVEVVDTLEFLRLVKHRGFTGLILQLGRGARVPSTFSEIGQKLMGFDLGDGS